MRPFSLFSMTGIAAIFDLVRAADFYIYAEDRFEPLADVPGGVSLSGFGFYDSPPDCRDVGHSTFLPDLDDVSSKHGVRCEGCGTGSGGPVDITELEWNTDANGHFTYYKDRDGSYVDLGGVVHGRCVADTSDSYNCVFPPGLSTLKGVSQLRCTPGAPAPEPTKPPAPEPTKPVLRIQPLGDSITKGSGSSDGNGYRRPLREMLADIVTDIDMIGSLADGIMEDSSHEGHSGSFLAEIHGYALSSLGASPNVVLLHAGTNNMDLDVDVDTAPGLVQGIIDEILDRLPDTTVIVAKIIWANDPRMQANTNAFNARIEELVTENERAGKHVLLADMSAIITSDDLNDRKHPNDKGYRKMATVWLDAIKVGIERGWIRNPKEPSETDGVGLGTDSGSGPVFNCEGGNWEKMGTVFDSFRTWEELGTLVPAQRNGRQDKVILADLNGDGLTDYILADDDGSVRAWINNGISLPFTEFGKINPPWQSVTGSMVRMADVDNDGRADMIALYPDGAAKVWKNTDDGRTFKALDANWATGLEVREKVRIEDMDGDGYADYVILYSGGAVKWARNTHNNGKDPSKSNWNEPVTIAPGLSGVPPDTTRLRDLDGDGKADYLVVYDGGAVRALRNTGNLNKDSAKRNWEDWGTIAPGVSGITGDMIRFSDIDGDGRADFLAVSADGSVRAWRNLGIIPNKIKNIRFADLDGDRRADIIFVDQVGAARAWLNQGDRMWNYAGEIAPGPSEDVSNSRIEFADVDGDGLADYLLIYGGGAVKAFLNNGNIPDRGRGRNWQEGLTISPGIEGAPGDKVHFADITGDGRADFLVIWDGGAVTAYLNNGNIPPKPGTRIWQDGYTVATGVGEPGSKVRFADITGDRRAEYLIVYDGGAVKSYNNTGNIPDVGRPRNWFAMGVIAAGVSPQGPVRFADINGDGKADYLTVFEDGHVNAHINTCSWKSDI
ncbi:hypothetical protein DL768_001714 [Monosporascus sp. mg162]|nr:hypothetical protein DL768_001714 [Monosporascus sp. mg162]